MSVAPQNLRDRVRLFTLEQAAGLLAISKRTLERLIAGGEFAPPLKIGRSSRVTSEDVDAYLDRLQKRRAPNGEGK